MKNDNSKFFLIVTILGVIVAFLLFILIFNLSSNSIKKEKSNRDEIAKEIEEDEKNNLTTKSFMVVEVFGDERKLKLYNYKEQSFFEVVVDTKTTLTDENGIKMVFYKIEKGDILDIKYNNSTRHVESVTYTEGFFRNKQTKGLEVSTESLSFLVDDKQYTYCRETIATYREEPMEITSISPYDTVVMKGAGNFVSYIEKTSGHGTVEITNQKKVTNGYVEVDRDDVVELSKFSTKDFPVGSHKIVIKGSNINPYIAEFDLKEDETHTIDLSKVDYLKANVYFNVDVDNVILTVDGVEKDENKAVPLTYGTHKVTVAKEGYETISHNITIGKPGLTVNYTMVEDASGSTFSIETTPEGADVYIDNKYVGISPLEVPVEYGEHNIVLRLDGYLQSSFDFVAEDTLHKFNIALKKDSSQ